MSNRSGPFAGITLTQQVDDAGAGLDQRLFSPRLARDEQPRAQEIGEEGSREVGKLGKRERGKFPSQLPTPHVRSGFAPDERPSRKDSFLFTNEEFEALDDLKLDLRRRFEIRSTKNDLARCALQHLIEDYRSKGKSSIAVRRLRTKGRT